MIFRVFSILIFCSGVATSVFAARAKDIDIQNIKRRIKNLKIEITEMKQSVEDLESQQRKFTDELSQSEGKFQDRFSRVLVPLLSWPSLPPAIQRTSWVEEEHLKLVLLKARERLVREPLELIAQRELMISRLSDMKEEISIALKQLESKEGMLNLQLEELQYLQKKNRSKKG